MLRVWMFAAALAAARQASSAADRPQNCFEPWLNDDPPKIVETLDKRVIAGRVEFTRLKFLSRMDEKTGEEVIIYACLARPLGPGLKPGVLVCHGGGGYADMVADAAIGWARRGYASVCQDQPGIGNRSKFRSSGPCCRRGASAFKIRTRPEDSALFDGVVAALNGLRLLRSQPDVDKSRVGVFGGSWGGYMTTMVSGLAGRRAKASFSVYGCGYFDAGSAWTHRLNKMSKKGREIWLKYLDAGRYARHLTAAHFVASPANDWYFWPCAVMRTLADVRGEKNWCFMPNESHMLSLPGGMVGPPKVNHRENRTYMEILWMRYYLKGEGRPFQRVSAVGEPTRMGRRVRVRFRVAGAVGERKATAWWAAGELPWRMKWWEVAPAKVVREDIFAADLPVEEPGEPVNWFATATDSRNVTCSTLIHTFSPRRLGFTDADRAGARFLETFEAASARRRWRRKYADRRPGRHHITSRAAHSGRRSLEIVPGGSSIVCFGVRAATLKRCAATKFVMWVKAAEKPCPLPKVELAAEAEDGERLAWMWRPSSRPQAGEEWAKVEMPLAEFKFEGRGSPPVPLLSPRLGQLRLTTRPDVHVFIDDVAAE